MGRVWEGGTIARPDDHFLLEWTGKDGELHGWRADTLEMALAKRAGLLDSSPRIVHVQAYNRNAVMEAWQAGAFDGDKDLNYGTREGHVRGVENFTTVPV